MSATRRTWPGDLAILAALALLPLAERALGTDFYGEMPKMFIFSILALGLNLVIGNAGILHLGMAAFFAVGAYAAGILTCPSYPFHLAVGFWGALLIAPLAAAAAGFLLGLPVLRLRGDYIAIVTLGFGEIAQTILKNLDEITKSARGIGPVPQPTLPGLSFGSALDPLPWYGFSLAILAIAFWATRRLEAGSLGRAWRALREDELAAASCGIPTVRAKLAAFALGAAYAGLAGALNASYVGTVSPSNYTFMVSAMVVVMVILGGMGNPRGVLAGVVLLQGFDLVAAPRLARMLSSPGKGVGFFMDYSNWRWLAFGLVLVLLMRFRPQGIFPARRAGGEDA